MTTEGSTWAAYYQATAQRPPRPLFRNAISRFERPGFAIDLGCGAGIETVELLRTGWHVLAVDAQPAAIEHVLAAVPFEHRARLETAVVSFEGMELPPADLIWSGLSLSFCPPAHFDDVWTTILASLRSGGRVACDLFGNRHAWANKEGTFLTEGQVNEMLRGVDVESFEEQEAERETAFQGTQHWHAFEVIGRTFEVIGRKREETGPVANV